MFLEFGWFWPILEISSVLYNAEYWIWIAKQFQLAMLHFNSTFHTLYSLIVSCQKSIWPIYISTTSSYVNTSMTIHFNSCVFWPVIRVRTTSWYRNILHVFVSIPNFCTIPIVSSKFIFLVVLSKWNLHIFCVWLYSISFIISGLSFPHSNGNNPFWSCLRVFYNTTEKLSLRQGYK